MSDKDKEPDKVTRDFESSLPLPPGIGPTIYSTTVHKDSDTYTGYGSSREEADKHAGEKYSEGKKD
ncbi:MAG: hypothetical protein HY033_13880 [Ignavibacteriae bacterium]|nr:hypothetical protein [Ignavibacteriota bacterium]